MAAIETVGELVAALLRQDQGARVAITTSSINGWLNEVSGLVVSPDGTVGVDTGDSTIGEEEADLTEVARHGS